MPVRMSALSRKDLLIPVGARVAGVPIDPTTDAVSFAFLTTGADPVSGDWKVGGWETDSTVTPAVHSALILVGPGGTVTLPVGTYNVWLRITDNPEQPVEQVAQLIIE